MSTAQNVLPSSVPVELYRFLLPACLVLLLLPAMIALWLLLPAPRALYRVRYRAAGAALA